MNSLIFALVGAPIFFGLVALCIKAFRPRRALVVAASFVQALIALAFIAWAKPMLPLRLPLELPGLEFFILAAELGMAAFIALISVRKKRFIPLALALIQTCLIIAGERWGGGIEVSAPIVIDELGLMLIFIIGGVGGLIVFDASGYMRSYHEEHAEIEDRRRLFACVMLVFLGAMYGLVISNDLRLMLFFWEITTLASFILIGYAKKPDSEKSAFLVLTLNLAGGLFFSLAVILMAARLGISELDKLVSAAGSGGAAALAIAPVALLALAGLVKSAQLPFTPWLLSAMVAPTPVSALLHSSTMVKAGVYLLIRLAPALAGRTLGYLVAFIGILTFIAGAFAAISQRNAKRILALSTVSNLGLITACAGVGGNQLVWVAFFLILFHAIAKALLFLSVGSASFGTGSLDVETMGGLIVSMPRTAFFLVVGISAMFVAPFGMLVSKWAAMEAFINMPSLVSPLMVVSLAYGSAATIFFWAKWLGMLVRISDPAAPRGLLESKVSYAERFAESALALLVIVSCVSFPLMSRLVVEPYLVRTYAQGFMLDPAKTAVTVLMVVMTLAVPGLCIALGARRGGALSGAYMSGNPSGPGLSYEGSKGEPRRVAMRSYYLERYFPEPRILRLGIMIGLLLVITLVGTAFL